MSTNAANGDCGTESDAGDARGEPSVAQAAIRKLIHLAKLIPKELSPGDRAILWILVAIGIVMISFAAVVAISKNTVALLVLFVLGMVLFAAAMIYFVGRKQLAQDRSVAEETKRRLEKNELVRAQIHEEEQRAAEEISQNGRIAWMRKVIALPLADDASRRQIVDDLEDIRKSAFSWLHKKHTDLEEHQVRVNVFLAKYEEAGKGVVCMLRMPDYLRLGMTGHTDEEIAFRPGEGATGRVFVEHESEVAVFDKDRQQWDDRYTLSEYQKRKIHKDLRWIISYPLKNEDAEAMAVLNVDCLGCVVAEDELHHLKGDLQPEVNGLEEKLNRFYAKVKVSVTVEPL